MVDETVSILLRANAGFRGLVARSQFPTAMASCSVPKNITVATRLEIIQKLEAGVRIKDLIREYGISKSSIDRYRKNALTIREFSENPRCMQMKRLRLSPHKDVDSQLYRWYLARKLAGDPVNDHILQKKAKELHDEFGGPTTFMASRGWLWRFKKKHGIGIVDIDEEATDTEEEAESFSDDTTRIHESYSPPPSPIDHEELDHTLYNLEKLAKTEPQIEANVKAILDYFNKNVEQ